MITKSEVFEVLSQYRLIFINILYGNYFIGTILILHNGTISSEGSKILRLISYHGYAIHETSF